VTILSKRLFVDNANTQAKSIGYQFDLGIQAHLGIQSLSSASGDSTIIAAFSSMF
jgi:hypothetical protein